MKEITFASMMLLTISGVTAQSSTAEPVVSVSATSVQAKAGDLATQRICMRCTFGGNPNPI